MPVGEDRRHDVCATHNNKHGFRGVEWHAEKGKFAARIEATPGKRGRWLGRYATAREAAIAYDDAARIEYGAAARLNFPEAGELPTTPTRRPEGLCPKGHAFFEFGYRRPDGGVTCRACNKEAARRSYRKRTSASPTQEITP